MDWVGSGLSGEKPILGRELEEPKLRVKAAWHCGLGSGGKGAENTPQNGRFLPSFHRYQDFMQANFYNRTPYEELLCTLGAVIGCVSPGFGPGFSGAGKPDKVRDRLDWPKV